MVLKADLGDDRFRVRGCRAVGVTTLGSYPEP